METDALTQFAIDILEKLANDYPWFSLFIFAVFGARMIFKPALALARVYVKSTKSLDDDAWLDKVEGSKVAKTVAFTLDWIFSIKLPALQKLSEAYHKEKGEPPK
jgi:hypothetical protein